MPFNQAIRKNSHILWTISLIQDRHPDAQTKTEFAEMGKEILESPNIDKLTICLADKLQRFRFMIEDGLTEEQATDKCQEMADRWYVDNGDYIETLVKSKNPQLLSWDEFLMWSEYGNTVKNVERLYKENNKFSRDVDGRVRQELNKISHESKITDRTQQIELIKRYIFEECAFQKFASSKYFDYELYKNPFPPAARDIKNNTDFVSPGVMVELYFTQFSSTPKNKSENKTVPQNSPIPTNLIPYGNIPCGIDFPPMWTTTKTYHYPAKSSYESVFTSQSPPKHSKEYINIVSIKSAEQRRAEFAAFIEKTLQLLPEKDQEKAIESLVKFTTNEIIPLCYTTSTLKI